MTPGACQAETPELPPSFEERNLVSGELTSVASELMTALDSMDVDRMMAAVAGDAQGVDEISRRWIRGRDELDAYLRQLVQAVSGVRSELRDTHEQIRGDTGGLSCLIEHDYTMDGNAQHISAPTTIVFHREAGEWKLALFHSVPLPEQA